MLHSSQAWSLECVYNGKHFSLELKSASDVSVLSEVFVLKEYEWQLDFNPKSILDLGAHWGDSTIYYAAMYPQATILAIEPNETIYNRLGAQATQFSNVRTLQVALGTDEGFTDLYVSRNTLGSSLVRREERSEVIRVKTLSLFDLCNLMKIKKFDLVKFDIEGAEEIIFKDVKNKECAKAFIGEVHLDLMNLTLDDVKEYFADFELSVSKISEMRYIVRAVKK